MSRPFSLARAAVAGLTVVTLVACDNSAPTAPRVVRGTPGFALLGNDRLPFAFTVTACGVTVEVSGTFHAVDTFTEAKSGRASAKSHINAKGTGVAAATGATYQWNDAINLSQVGTIADGPLTQTFRQTTRLVGQGSATDIRFDAHGHITTNANGEVTVFFDNSEVGCK